MRGARREANIETAARRRKCQNPEPAQRWLRVVIPGRAAGARPESITPGVKNFQRACRDRLMLWLWIPALARSAGMTAMEPSPGKSRAPQ